MPGLSAIHGVEESSRGVIVAVVPGREDAEGESGMREVEGFGELRFSGSAVLRVFIVEKPGGIEHLPGLSAVAAAGEEAVLASIDVVSVAECEISPGESDEDFVAPLPDAVVGWPSEEFVGLDRGDVMPDGEVFGGFQGCSTDQRDERGEEKESVQSHESLAKRSGYRVGVLV